MIPTSLFQRMWRARGSYLLLLPTVVLLVTFQLVPAINGFAYAF